MSTMIEASDMTTVLPLSKRLKQATHAQHERGQAVRVGPGGLLDCLVAGKNSNLVQPRERWA